MKVKILLAVSDKSLSCEISEVEPHHTCEFTDAQPPQKKSKNALKILFNDDDNDTPTIQSLTNRETELLWYSQKETLDFESDPLKW